MTVPITRICYHYLRKGFLICFLSEVYCTQISYVAINWYLMCDVLEYPLPSSGSQIKAKGL